MMNSSTLRERSNFSYSFALLPKKKRWAIHAIYDFCRRADDIVDEESGTVEEKQAKLASLRTEVEHCFQRKRTSLPDYLSDAVLEYRIPLDYFLALIDGVQNDLFKTRYETFAELRDYCYAVASIPGLMSIQVFGYEHEQTRDYAIHLGYALQLTNILRDIQTDAERGRIYLPAEDLAAFGYDEQSLSAGVYNDAFTSLMQFEVARTKEYYGTARSFLPANDRRSMFPAEIMDRIYFQLLRNIEHAHYNIFNGRIAVSKSRKIFTALCLWLNSYLPFFQ